MSAALSFGLHVPSNLHIYPRSLLYYIDNVQIIMLNNGLNNKISWILLRYHSPPEKDALHDYMAAKKEDSGTQESPILKALRDYEEEKGLKGWNKESSFQSKLVHHPH